jgi:energy-coupling factor transport system substrate-specific component
LFASALITGAIGPWLAFQMLAAGWVAMFAGFIPKRLNGKSEIFVISVYAIIATQFFGILMNLQLWPWLIGTDSQLSFVASDSVIDNLHRFAVFHLATSLSWDIPRAVFTVILISITGKPILVALRRAKVKLVKTTSEPVIGQRAA